ncbi:DUF192 domain-containing protein [Streptomyces sp. 35G-GA-8]|uniref:DUF192 domain-containing protein n=1 Tax=Streptomyces sp. 35G-GA-8 TaxID=2939434 RepID=UPI00201ED998|nr:DUF192 domain-containing protein [Streptomyces sp. 35G-GA-8]MCL7376009.1 DUF192 domain-containing protein [Streptomyces sp. 35G-GA-8]
MGTWRNGTGRLTVAGQDVPVELEIAASYGTRRRGLLGRDGTAGALLITPCNSVHTFRMRFTIDVAYLDKELQVIEVHTLKPGRMPLPRWRARHVLEAEGGAMERWGVRPGVRLSVSVDGGGDAHCSA